MPESRLDKLESRLDNIERKVNSVQDDMLELLGIFRTIKQGGGFFAWIIKALIYLGGICFAVSAIWIIIVWIKTGVMPGTESSPLFSKSR